MGTKVTIVYDNRCDCYQLQEGWGFSAFIEHEGSKILFDSGGDATTFFANAEKIQLPYGELTHLLFSHRHWDHISGFEELLRKINKEAALYLPRTFPWKLVRKGYSSLKKAKVVHSFEEIGPQIYSLVFKCGFWLYEQILVLKTPSGLGIITGCAHPGIIQILHAAQEQLQQPIHFVLGGFHQLFTPPNKTAEIVQQFKTLQVEKIAPCHCSGDHLIRQFQEAYGPNFYKVGTGTVLSF